MSVGKIKEFDVEEGNWTLYCERVKMYFKANSVKDDLQLPTLISLVGDRVYELMVTLANPKKPTDMTLDEVINLVTDHLQPKPSIWAERFRFRQKRQGSGVSVKQYVAELKKLTRYCDFGSALDDNLRDQFVCGVSSDLIRQRLFAEPTSLTFSKAVTLATSLEAAERDAAAVDSSAGAGSASSEVHALAVARKGGARSTGPGAQRRRSGAGTGAAGAAEAGGCLACGGAHTTTGCRYANFVCSTCKNKGHLRKVCPFKKSGGSTSTGTSHRPKAGSKNDQEVHHSRHLGQDGSSGSESEDHEEPMFQMAMSDYKPVSLTVLVNDTSLAMEVDTGTACSCISEDTYERLFKNIKLSKSEIVFKFYDGSKVTPAGKLRVTVQYKQCKKVLDLYVVKKGSTSLIGRQWLAELNIQIPVLSYVHVNKVDHGCEELSVILDRYKEVLSSGLGRYTGGEAVLRVRAGAEPVYCRARPVPYALRDRVDAELDAMLRSGVIEPVDCSDWATPLVLVNKSDGALRVCADFKVTLNPVLMVDRYPLPRVDDLLSNLSGGEEFSKIDLSQAYNQICLSEDSKKYTVVNTHRGLFRYNRLVYGLSSSSGIFQRIMCDLVKDIPNVQCFCDDIVITGKDRKSHLKSLEALFQRLCRVGLKVKKSKCSFLANEIKYLGFVVDKHGIRPDTDKLRAIKEMPVPHNVSELKSFLGMVNFYARFVPRLSDMLHPLHELLSKGRRWRWGRDQGDAFRRVKRLMLSGSVLAHYDPTLQVVLTCDASARGVGGVLSQRTVDGQERPVAYVSRKLTTPERAYSQIHREALAIVHCVKKFHQYLYGRKFLLKTDHKPLVSIFGPQSGIPTMAASRMQRWALILSAYDFDIEYVGTGDNGADIFSRLPVGDDDKYEPPEQTYLHFSSDALLLDCSKIKKETSRDPLLSRVLGYIENGWPDKVDVKQLEAYYNRRTELYVELGCVMWGRRLVVPTASRDAVLRELHAPHMGIVKTKALARSYVWWPGVDEAVEAVCRACCTCAELSAAPPAAAPVPWPQARQPYDRVHMDFLGPIDGNTYLVTVDAMSKWIEVFRMTRTTADATIGKLRESWARWGLPRQVVSDNGPPFSSREFAEFVRRNGIRHTFSAPYHPSSNGAGENAVKIVKKTIIKARREGVNVDLAITRFLLMYHNTPHCTTGETPARLLQGRKLRTCLDIIKQDSNSDKAVGTKASSGATRVLEQGDPVWYRNFGQGQKWGAGEILNRTGKNNYTVKACDGSPAHRHVDQLKRRSSCVFPERVTHESDGVARPVQETADDRGGGGGVEPRVDRGDGARAGPPAPECSPQGAPSSADDLATDDRDKAKSPRPRIASPAVHDRPKRTVKPVIRWGFDID